MYMTTCTTIPSFSPLSFFPSHSSIHLSSLPSHSLIVNFHSLILNYSLLLIHSFSLFVLSPPFLSLPLHSLSPFLSLPLHSLSPSSFSLSHPFSPASFTHPYFLSPTHSSSPSLPLFSSLSLSHLHILNSPFSRYLLHSLILTSSIPLILPLSHSSCLYPTQSHSSSHSSSLSSSLSSQLICQYFYIF